METVMASRPDDAVDPAHLRALLAMGPVHASEIARRIGVDVGTISRWKRGIVPMSRSRWLAVLAVCGLPSTWEPPKEG